MLPRGAVIIPQMVASHLSAKQGGQCSVLINYHPLSKFCVDRRSKVYQSGFVCSASLLFCLKDLTTFRSAKTGRGPLGADWKVCILYDAQVQFAGC